MNILILTPELALYQTVILILLSLGCSNIASHIHSRWFANKAVNVVMLHNVIKFIIVIWGMSLIPIYSLFNATIWVQILSFFPALLLAVYSVKIERFIYRKNNKIRLVAQIKQYITQKSIENKTQGLAKKNLTNKVNLKNVHEHHARFDSVISGYQLRDIVLIAIFEEIIFRGFLWQLSLKLQIKSLIIISLLSTVILFGATHLTLGRGQFYSKTILGFFCLTEVVLTNSIFPAIVTHVVFNIFAYKEMFEATSLQSKM